MIGSEIPGGPYSQVQGVMNIGPLNYICGTKQPRDQKI